MLVCRVILSLYRCLFPCTVTMLFHPVACIKYKLSVCVKRVLVVVTKTMVKNLGLAGSSEQVGRFVPSLGC